MVVPKFTRIRVPNCTGIEAATADANGTYRQWMATVELLLPVELDAGLSGSSQYLKEYFFLVDQRRQLVTTEAENSKTRADAQAYAVKATLEPLTRLDPKALQVLAARNVDPRLMVAMAFQEIAANATKVGNLNISPELLQSLMQHTNGN